MLHFCQGSVSIEKISRLLAVILGHKPCLKVKVVWADLLLFNLILRLAYNLESKFKWDCRFSEKIKG